MTRDEQRGLLTVQSAAEMLAVSPATIRRWMRQGRISIVRLSTRAVRVRVDELMAVIDNLTERRDGGE